MSVAIQEISSRRELKEFIRLPARIHRGRQNWIPPIYMDDWKYFDPQKNPAFAYCDVTRVLARNGKGIAGRIMGIINHRYNGLRGEKTARFCNLECWNEPDVAHALLGHVEEWARRHGMERIIGPYGFSDQDPEGFLIEGFEHIATIATYYNDPYMLEMMAAEGYTKDVDYMVYKLDITNPLPDWYQAVHKRIQERSGFRLVEFLRRRELKPFIEPIFELMNECYSDIYGYTPLDRDEMHRLAKQYLPLLDPRFVKVVMAGDILVGFVIGIPCLSEGIKKAGGHLFPIGILLILREAKKTKQLDLLLGGIKPDFQKKGIDVLLGKAMIDSARNAGFHHFDSHHELETNVRMRAENERLGGKVYKRYRVFQKSLRT